MNLHDTGYVNGLRTIYNETTTVRYYQTYGFIFRHWDCHSTKVMDLHMDMLKLKLEHRTKTLMAIITNARHCFQNKQATIQSLSNWRWW